MAAMCCWWPPLYAKFGYYQILDAALLHIVSTCNIVTSSASQSVTTPAGTTVKVTTVDGLVDLKIPGGTQPGTTLVMTKRGVPRLGVANSRGDHQVGSFVFHSQFVRLLCASHAIQHWTDRAKAYHQASLAQREMHMQTVFCMEC